MTLTIKPRNKKELRAIKQFFTTFDIQFEEEDDTKISKADFFAMIDERKKDVAEGKVLNYDDKLKNELFKSVL